ncbi:MAG: hypothetical protein KJ630_11505 [Proteobacteria bacterium]|nr:hypothetical protein [Pseudomonadota bacterium]
MRTSLCSALIFLLTLATLSVLPVLAKQPNIAKYSPPAEPTGNVPTSTFQQQSIVVEDLAAEVHSDSGIITITAKIKNVSRAMIKGYATVHLLSGEGKKMLSYEEELNNGEAFAHGTSVELEITARVGDIKSISSISVDFTKF